MRRLLALAVADVELAPAFRPMVYGVPLVQLTCSVPWASTGAPVLRAWVAKSMLLADTAWMSQDSVMTIWTWNWAVSVAALAEADMPAATRAVAIRVVLKRFMILSASTQVRHSGGPAAAGRNGYSRMRANFLTDVPSTDRR